MKIAVYGMGRFGSFWASELSKRFDVDGYSRSSRDFPESVGKIASEDGLAGYDVIFLCCAISAVEEVLTRISPLIGRNAVVIDTCSVKVAPVRLMEQLLPPSCGIIATHPMFGPDSGRNGIDSLPMVFHTVRDSDGAGEFWRNAFEGMGLRIYDMSPDEHDREAAFTQGVTHFIGRVLNKLDLRESRIGTLGYTKLLEIVEQTCNDPLQLFYDLQKYNPHTGEMRVKLKQALHDTMEQF